MIYYQNDMGVLHQGDALAVLRELPSECAHTCVTSPPYWGLRDYGTEGQIGLERTPEEYIERIVAVFREVRRVLRRDGTLWLNMGDGYATGTGGKHGHSSMTGGRAVLAEQRRASIPAELKQKDLIGMPWRLAFALQADGWYLRQDIIWSKPNPMPESVRDRCTKAHEYLFLLSKSPRYYFDAAAIREPLAISSILRLSQDLECQAGSARGNGGAKTNGPMKAVMNRDNTRYPGKTKIDPTKGTPLYAVAPHAQFRNKRSVWTITTAAFKGAHFATFPPELITPCILAGAPIGSVAMDPFMGSGTVARVAESLDRHWIGIEIRAEYCEMTKQGVQKPLLDMLGAMEQ